MSGHEAKHNVHIRDLLPMQIDRFAFLFQASSSFRYIPGLSFLRVAAVNSPCLNSTFLPTPQGRISHPEVFLETPPASEVSVTL